MAFAMCTPFGVALAGRKSGLAHCQETLGSGLVHLEDSVPIRQSLAYSPRGTCACAQPVYAFLAGHMSGSRMSGLCVLPRSAPSAMALDLGRPLILKSHATTFWKAFEDPFKGSLLGHALPWPIRARPKRAWPTRARPMTAQGGP